MSARLLLLILAFIVGVPLTLLAAWWIETTERRHPVRTVSDAELTDIRRTRKPEESRNA